MAWEWRAEGCDGGKRTLLSNHDQSIYRILGIMLGSIVDLQDSTSPG
jgi:hypothetical protein